MRTLMILLRKEFILFWKNKFMPKVTFIFPCAVVLIIPLVTTMDVKHVGVAAVVNQDNSQLSRNVMTDLSSTPFFSVQTVGDYDDGMELIKRGECDVNVTPVKTTVFVLSKVIPYWIIGIIDITLAMLIARAVYDLAPAGSLASIYLATILFIFVMSGLGIVIANRSASMSQSMFLMFFVVVIFVLMSGLLTPISSMPDWAQKITYALSPRYYIDIMRSVYLKATSVADLQLQFTTLTCFAMLTNLMAASTYRKLN